MIQDFIAIVERLRTLQHRCHWNVGEFADAYHGVVHLGGFVRQLVLVAQMLQVTATTTVVQWTGGWDAPGRRLAYRAYLAKGIPSSRLCDTHVDHITRCCPWHKHRQAIEIAHTVPAMRQALDGHRTTGPLWLDL